jgi:60 kDa SS-A/Ro ribonucleoprotein
MTYLKNVLSKKATPQSQPIPGAGQVPNSAGGYAWGVDDWVRLDRFLILGSEGGSYYASESRLTLENAEAVANCIAADGLRVVARIVEISEAGRAPKNDPALFALALCAALGEAPTRRAAFAALPKVCRIGTHLFHFAEFIDGFRGWGRGLRAAVASWYNTMPADRLAYQAVKYQQRDGWSHRDLLRLAHPVPEDADHTALYYWMTKGWEGVGDAPHPNANLRLIWAFERANRAQSAREIVELIREYGLPREAVPTAWLNEAAVWEALLVEMPLTALIRNLATLTRVGLLTPNSDAARQIAAQVTDQERLRRARVHPIAVLSALKTYAQGHGERGKHTWTPVPQVVDALDRAFYASFGNVEATGKRWMLALDVSGSMSYGNIAGVPGLTPRDASAAMALVTAAVEPNHTFTAFSDKMVPVTISPRQRLDDVIRETSRIPFGGTDCALPMVWAQEKKIAVDVFVVLTDSETWFGQIHPAQSLRKYRERTGIPAKLIVVGMVANKFSIADPNDAGMLDVVGFDTATPQLMADFARP